MWGHRFPNIVEYDRKNAVYVADYDQFDSTEPVSRQNQSSNNTHLSAEKPILKMKDLRYSWNFEFDSR